MVLYPGEGGALILDIILIKNDTRNKGCFSGPGNVYAYIVKGCKNVQNLKKGCVFGDGWSKFFGKKRQKIKKKACKNTYLGSIFIRRKYMQRVCFESLYEDDIQPEIQAPSLLWFFTSNSMAWWRGRCEKMYLKERRKGRRAPLAGPGARAHGIQVWSPSHAKTINCRRKTGSKILA